MQTLGDIYLLLQLSNSKKCQSNILILVYSGHFIIYVDIKRVIRAAFKLSFERVISQAQ